MHISDNLTQRINATALLLSVTLNNWQTITATVCLPSPAIICARLKFVRGGIMENTKSPCVNCRSMIINFISKG